MSFKSSIESCRVFLVVKSFHMPNLPRILLSIGSDFFDGVFSGFVFGYFDEFSVFEEYAWVVFVVVPEEFIYAEDEVFCVSVDDEFRHGVF